MNTKDWGPPTWKSMFIIAANYPIRVKCQDIELMKSYKKYYESYENILPCKYCRESYKGFINELPITEFLIGRKELMYWLYLIKDKVNKKLIKHEELLIKEIKNTSEYRKSSPSDKRSIIKKIFRTKESPDFEEVCKYYEQFRARCSVKTKSCSIPKRSY